MANGATRFVPIVVKLDGTELNAFEARVKRIEATLNRAVGKADAVKSSGTAENAARQSVAAQKKVEDDFLKWKASEANKAYAQAQRHLKEMTAARKTAEKEAANAAKAGLKDVESALLKTGKALASSAGVPMRGLLSSVGELATALGPVGIGITAAAVATVGLGLAAVATEAKLFELTKTILEEERRIGDLASKAGVSIAFFDTLKYGADQSHISTEKLSNSLLIFQKHLLDAGQGSETARRQLAAFRINADDIANAMNGNSEPAIRKFLNTLGQAPDNARKMGGELKNLGRGGGDLSNVMKNLGGNVDSAMESLKRSGVVLTEDGYKKAKAFEKALADLDRQITKIERTIVENVAPAITTSIEQLSKTVTDNTPILGGLVSIASGIAKAFAYAAFWIRDTALGLEYMAGHLTYAQMNDRAGEAKILLDLATGTSKEFESKIKEKNTNLERPTKPSKGSGTGKALLDSQRALQFAIADESLRATKARLDNEDAAIKASYAERLTSFADYKAVETQIANQMTHAELKRNRMDFFALEDEKTALVKRAAGAKGKEVDQYQAAINNIDAKMIELDGRYSTILGERAKKLTELNKAGIDAQKQWDDFIENQNIALAGLSGEDQKFAAAKLKNQKTYQDAIDKWQKEVDARAKSGGGGDINLSTAELSSLNEVLRLSNLAVDVERESAHIAKTKNDLAEQEKEINTAVTLGIYSQLQGRDAILAIQRQQKPILEAELAALEKVAKEQGKFVSPETLSRIKELHVELATLGVDLEAVAREGRILHQMDIMPEHVNDNVRDFLSNITTMQESLENFRTNVVKGVFSEVDKQIDKISSKMGPFKAFFDSTFGQLLKEQAHLQLAKQFEKIFGIKLPQSAQAQHTAATVNLTASNNNLKSSIDALNVTLGGSPATAGAGGSVSSSSLPSMASLATGGTGFSGMSTIGGSKGSTAISQGMSFATSSAGKSIFKSIASHLPFGKGSKSGGSSGIGGGFSEDGGGGGIHEAGHTKDAEGGGGGKAGGAMMGLGMVESFTNSGGKMGSVESGMMQAGMALGATPAGWALMAGAIGLGLAGKLGIYGKSDQKAIRDAVKSDPLYGGLDLKGKGGNAILDQIKQVGDQQWPGKLKQHIVQLIHMDQVKQMIDGFAQFDLKNNPNYANSQLAKTRQLSDINASANQFTHRAMGGPVSAGMPYMVGERRPELFVPNVSGMIHRDPVGDLTRRVMDGARSKMSAQMGGQGHGGTALGFAINALVEQVSRLTSMSPGHVLMTGAQQNPTAISGGLIEGLRQNFGHRRELNGLTGA